MINTRGSIYKTLMKNLRELTKHAQNNHKEFKKILIAIILNDLKEWAEYIPKEGDSEKLVELLDNYIINNCFIIDRFPMDSETYINVNTPQTNNTWRIVHNPCGQNITPQEAEDEECGCHWEQDPSCETKIVYYQLPEGYTNRQYLENTYGKHGGKLKTICDKMDVFINRETGEAWYLDVDCTWKPIGAIDHGMTQEQVEELLSHYKIHNQWNLDNSEIELSLVKDDQVYDNTLDLVTVNDVEEMV